MIQVTNLHKSFGEVHALRGVTFHAPDGQITGLLGPNGAGKTTTLRVLYTLLASDDGVASVDGFDVCTQALQVQQRIGALPDARGIYPRLTARENIRYYGHLHGLDNAVLESRINALVQMLDMHDIADRRADGFSSGERLKVAIARALIHDPANVLLDEPTNGLDVMSTRAMRDVIRRLRDEGKCVLFSSHVMQEVAALCNHIVIIARGKVVGAGTPDELRRAANTENLEDAFVEIIGTEEGLE
ncbi:MAG TPA: ATP-binding cassette domain-containing protein [Candidatus Hydrogenedentes bacterium]|nr:ATP-binding cassette domain-containing protein [Candidatus Hydrogenedentota bacterium]